MEEEKKKVYILAGVTMPEGYVPTPRENYDYDRFGDWWPKKWKGPAWVCPEGHQMPKEKYDWGFSGGNEYSCFCPGCGRWVARKLMKFAATVKQCTMGYARRKSDLEDDMDRLEAEEKKIESAKPPVQEGDEVPARRKTRKRRSSGNPTGDCVDSGKARRRKSKRGVGSGD